MSDKIPATAKPAAAETVTPVTAPPVRRHPGHRGADVRDTVAEMAAKAHEISMEAGSKMAAAMKEVIGAAAGLSTFTLESARDLVQYMVRRSQMTQDEADRLIREAEDAWSKKHKGKKPPPRLEPKPKVVLKPVPYSLPRAAPPTVLPNKTGAPVLKKVAAAKPAAKKAPAKKAPAKKAAAKKTAAKRPAHKPAHRKPAHHKPVHHKPAHKKAARPAAKKKAAPKK
jgi:polyhydroxyalkanoate synthesis regulator phasin